MPRKTIEKPIAENTPAENETKLKASVDPITKDIIIEQTPVKPEPKKSKKNLEQQKEPKPKAKRTMSEKQLENLKKGRERLLERRQKKVE